MNLCPNLPRNFPLAFGKKIVRLWTEALEMPRTILRQKETISPDKTDRELFEELDCGDLWSDAGLVETFLYLISNKKCIIPNEWYQTMATFKSEMQKWDPFLNPPCICCLNS